MPQPFILSAIPALFVSTFLMAHPVFAESSPQATLHPKSIPLKTLAEKQTALSKNLILLDAKAADKASSSTDKHVMDQANLIHKASTEAKQAADDLTQATTMLSKNGL
jgi:hypothetical protein